MAGKIYVIQEHHARKLHWDLRLEMDGALRSWVLAKEPPTEKAIKRLAIPTADHALGYADFEGIIPEGSYGAGKVRIWDKGSYELEEKDKKKIVFRINGKRLKGRYCLVNFKEDKWLFFKL